VLDRATRTWANKLAMKIQAGMGKPELSPRDAEHFVALQRAAVAFDDLARAIVEANEWRVREILTRHGYNIRSKDELS